MQTETSIPLYLLIVLIFLASLSSFFGRNLPKSVWWISIVSAGLSGLVYSFFFTSAPYPMNIILGLFISIGAIFIVVILRMPRRNHPR
jgi:uncharacterized membrane protein